MKRLTFLFLLCCSCALAQVPTFVYTNNDEHSGTKSVSAFSVSFDGSLVPVSGTPFSTGVIDAFTSSLNRTITTTSSKKPFLYVIYRQKIAGFSIDLATGVLTPVPGSPFPYSLPGVYNETLTTTPDDKYLIVSRWTQVAVYIIGADGSLTPTNGKLYDLGNSGEILALKVTGDGRFLAVGQVYPSRISMFTISALGELNPVPGSPFSAPVFSYNIDINCASNLLFAGEGSGSVVPNRIAVFNIALNGALAPVVGSPFSGPGSDSVAVLLRPDDKTLFVTNLIRSTISSFSVAADGALTSILGSPFPEPGCTFNVGLGTDLAGKFLYTACQNGVVGAFDVASDGSLTAAQGQPFTALGNPPSDLLSLTVFPPKTCAAVDHTKPVSRVSPLPTFEPSASFNVQWSGADRSSGIRDYTIFVSDNGGPFAAWLTDSTLTSATFTGQLGHIYGFYSLAVDNAGNQEDPKTAAEATTRIDTTPPLIIPQISGTLGNNGWYRSNATISWSVSDPESGITFSSGCNTSTLTANTSGITLTCSATNGAGLSSSVPIVVKIDKIPPILSGLPPAGCSLWPVNHKFIQVADVKASDTLSGLVPGSLAVTGSSNEPSDSSGPDIVITPDRSGGFLVELRLDRIGTGNGRVYTINAKALDNAGNSATATSICTVPHDQSH